MEEILACRVCMSTNVKLYDMFKNQLITAYEILTGLEVTLPSKLPTCICGVCSTLLVKCTQFRETCQRTHDLLTFAYQQNHEVSTEYIESLKLNYHPLSNLSLNTVVDAGLSETNASAAALQLNSTDVIRESVKTDSDSAQCELRSVKIEKFHDDEATEEATDDNDFKYEVNIDDSVNVAGKFEKDESTDDELDQSHVDSQFDELFTVKFLTKEQQLEEIQARKMSANYKTSLYKCDKCFKGFMTEATFKNHLGKHEPSSGRYECEICLVRLPTKVSIRDHNARCHEREYTCREAGCSFVVKARSQALAHTKWHNGHVYVCKTCGATFRKRTSHLSHVRLLHPSEHVCLVCGESFIGKRGLLMHGKKMHKQSTENVTTTEDAVFTCDACSVEFRTKDALLKHLAMAVGDCADCKPCVHCGENIGDDCDMKEHVLTHFGRKLCDLCKRTFANERGYALHVQQVHWRRGAAAAAGRGGDPLYVCEICGKKFKTKGLLTYHQRKHTGETPFACTFCPKKYALHEYLKVHLRKHTGETPYPCGECPKKFTDKAALSRHLRVHTGEKPYSCDHCGKSFSQSNSLKVHVQTVHLKQPTPYKSKKRKKPKDINFSTVG